MEMNQARYGSYGVVSVLGTFGGLTKIRTEATDEFWVKTEKLSAIACPDIDESDGCWQRFVDYLNHVGYKLEVYATATALEQVGNEYIDWAKESLPDSAIHIKNDRPTPREWRLFFTLQPGVVCPFPIELMGVTGKHPCKNPRGLLRNKTGKVDVYFASIIEQLVRAGLRVTTN